MRRKDKAILDPNTIEEILINSNICRIALFDTEFPYIVPLNYGYKDNALYFHSATSGKKLDLIRNNSKVGFEIEQNHKLIKAKESCNWTTKYRSVMGTGTIEIITDFDAKIIGLDILMQHHGKEENSYKEKEVNKIVVLKLNIIKSYGKQSGEY
jgi:nitroimidazol reductase NimA-like FMN-containing flavoprotein (pyridoxamine 5'-phosphate oxidase superfamily)